MDRDDLLAELLGLGFDLELCTNALNQPECFDLESSTNWYEME